MRPGDTVAVKTAELSVTCETGHVITWTDRGWTGKVASLWEEGGTVLARVTKPDRAGVQVVRADRLTHKR